MVSYSDDLKKDTEIAYCQMVLFIYKYHHYFYLCFAQNAGQNSSIRN